jgi:hypothetical protein
MFTCRFRHVILSCLKWQRLKLASVAQLVMNAIIVSTRQGGSFRIAEDSPTQFLLSHIMDIKNFLFNCSGKAALSLFCLPL